jgi:hypothetical protein
MRLGLVLVLVGTSAFCILTACSSDPEPAGTNTQADSGTANEGGSGLGSKCAAEATLQSCATCCGYKDGILDAYEKAYDKCACEGACKTACATTICATPATAEASEACGACLEEEDTLLACDPIGNDECEKDPGCKAFVACDRVAVCLDKPEGKDGG